MTYEEWLVFEDGTDLWSELIDGKIRRMETPPECHADAMRELGKRLTLSLINKPYAVFPIPHCVRIFPNEDTAFLPDMVVVRDKQKLSGSAVIGAPDLIVEILAPDSMAHDKVTKFREYLRAKVPEYWIVDPYAKMVTVYSLVYSKYSATVYADGERLHSHVLPSVSIDLGVVFGDVKETE